MVYCLNATHLFCEDDGCAIILGFADDEIEPSKFVILQQTHGNDAQDEKLGMDKIHIQVGGCCESIYGGINAVYLTGDKISIQLDDAACSTLKVDRGLEIIFSTLHPNAGALISQLEKMLKRNSIHFCVGDSSV